MRGMSALDAAALQGLATFNLSRVPDYNFLCIGSAAISPNDIDTWIANFGLELEYSIAADIPE